MIDGQYKRAYPHIPHRCLLKNISLVNRQEVALDLNKQTWQSLEKRIQGEGSEHLTRCPSLKQLRAGTTGMKGVRLEKYSWGRNQ